MQFWISWWGYDRKIETNRRKFKRLTPSRLLLSAAFRLKKIKRIINQSLFWHFIKLKCITIGFDFAKYYALLLIHNGALRIYDTDSKTQQVTLSQHPTMLEIMRCNSGNFFNLSLHLVNGGGWVKKQIFIYLGRETMMIICWKWQWRDIYAFD